MDGTEFSARRTAMADRTPGAQPRGWSRQARTLAGACLAHALHDGYSDQLYALLPIWQQEFGLTYAGLAMIRALYYGTMGGLQIPAERFLGRRLSARSALVLATVLAAAGYLVVALPFGFPILCLGLVVAGIGSSVQHPRASMLVISAYPAAPRGPLGIYNFAGDLGKATVPAIVALLLPVLAWRTVVGGVALAGVAVAAGLLALLPRQAPPAVASEAAKAGGGDGRGFNLLLTIGAFDTATRMGYLLFLPFLVQAKHGREATVGLALALLFAGGALGKACCGWLGLRIGVVWSVIVTEAATCLLMLATLLLPLWADLVVLPFLGVVLNGTSSVLYGTVPELARRGDAGPAFALFYTSVIGAGGLAPIAYGAIADHSSRTIGIIAASLTAAAIIPMVLALGPFLRTQRA